MWIWRGPPVRRQLFGLEVVVDPCAVGAGAGSALQDEQHFAHAVAVFAMGDLVMAGLLQSAVRLVDGPLNLVAAADPRDAGCPLPGAVATSRFGFVTCSERTHVGEQVDAAGGGPVGLAGRRSPHHRSVRQLFVAPALIEGFVAMM